MQDGHHTSHNWGSSSSQQQQQHPYDSSNYSYSNQYIPTSNGNTPSSSFMALSQPNTPRPQHITHDDTTTDDSTLSSRSTERVSHFALTQLPSDPTQPQRLNEDPSMFTFETGPSFTPTKQHLDIWNMDRTNGHQVRMHAKIDRGFFLAGQDWTCYRRNYFQVSATFDVHGISYLMQGPEVPCLVQTEQGQLCQVDYFSIGVRASVSGTSKKIDLIQHTAKRDKGPQMTPQPRGLRAGGRLHMAPVGSNHSMVTFERMQFKTATANNGKRRAAQQYYELVIDLYANTSTGTAFCVASCTSAPLVVRGRSPGHYADSNTRYRGNDIHPVMPYSRPGQGPSHFDSSSYPPSTSYYPPMTSPPPPPPPPPPPGMTSSPYVQQGYYPTDGMTSPTRPVVYQHYPYPFKRNEVSPYYAAQYNQSPSSNSADPPYSSEEDAGRPSTIK